MPNKKSFPELSKRYSSAYLVGRSLMNIGRLIQILGVAIAIIIPAVAIAYANQFSFVLYVLTPLGVLFWFYQIGLLLSAMGQLNSAILDIAINTSPLLTQEEKFTIILPEPKEEQTKSAQRLLQCADCKTLIPADAKICPNCGAEFEE
jgi:hypothetical protein